MTEEANHDNSQTDDVLMEMKARTEVIPFAIALPPSIVQGPDDPPLLQRNAAHLLFENKGMVGTIIVMPKSIMVWVGWGILTTRDTSTNVSNANSTDELSLQVGTGEYRL
jgi:hypothetical protein